LGGVMREKDIQKRGASARQLIEPTMRAESEARTALDKETARATKAQLDEKKRVQEEFVTNLGTAQTALESKLGQQPERTITAFNPERATELAVLTAIMGAFAGGISGRAGLSAMKGVSEGYRSGQEDLYKREVDNYEAALNKYKQTISEAKQIYDNSVKLETEQRGAGMIEVEKLVPLLQDSVITAKVRAQDLKGVGDSLREAMKLADQIDQKKVEAGFKPVSTSQQIRLATVQGGDGKSYIVDAFTFPFGSDPSEEKKGVLGIAPPKTAEAGSRERTFAQRVFGSIKGMAVDAKNLLTLPANAGMPELAGVVANDPNSIFSSLIAMTARTITEPEKRAFQQITEQIAQAMANIEGQGLASGATIAKVRAFDALRPKAGDNAINMALYFARVRQELETGIEVFLTNYGANDEQKKQAKEILEKLPSQIPFTVEEVFKNVLDKVPNGRRTLSGEMQQLINQRPFFTELDPNAPTAQAAPQVTFRGELTADQVVEQAELNNITPQEAARRLRQKGYTIKE
jgi:hypothetical protein